jgi:hypothetical protein
LSVANQDVSAPLQAAAAPAPPGLVQVIATATQCFPAWVCANSGSGTVNPGQLALAQYPALTAASVAPAHFTYDIATGNNLFIPGSSITAASPVSDIRSFGGINDGTTDNTAALKSAIAQACLTSGHVFLPGVGSGYYIADGTTIANSSNHTACSAAPGQGANVQIRGQGKLILGNTLVLPNDVDLVADGFGTAGQFQMRGPVFTIVGPAVYGSIGTAVAANAVTAQSFTPTFVGGSIANLVANTAISIADTIPCNIQSISRDANSLVTLTVTSSLVGSIVITSAGSGQTPGTYIINATGGSPTITAVASVVVGGGGTVTSAKIIDNGQGYTSAPAFTVSAGGTPGVLTASMATECRIPAGTKAAVSGVTDTTFNGTPMVITSDYVTGIMTYSQANVANSGVTSSSGGVLTGMNQDTYETVQIVSQTSGTATAYFMHNHESTAQWGMVAVMPVAGTLGASSNGPRSLIGVNITNNYGAGFWLAHDYFTLLDGVAFGGTTYIASIPMEIASSASIHITHSSLLPPLPKGSGCLGANNCLQTPYPAGLRITSLPQASNDGSGYIVIDGKTYIGAGVVIDTNGNLANLAMADIELNGVIIEQPLNAGVMLDTRFVNLFEGPILNHVSLQDNFMNYQPCLVEYTDAARPGPITINNYVAYPQGQCIKSAHTNGQLVVNGIISASGNTMIPTYLANGFTLNDGVTTITDLRSVDSGLASAVLPYDTRASTTNPASWTCVGTGCKVIPGFPGPDGPKGAFQAGELVTGSVANPSITIASITGGTTTGDWVFYGVWCMNGINNISSCVFSSNVGEIGLGSTGTTERIDNTNSSSGSCAQFQSAYLNDWFHPIVCANKITTGQSSSHVLSVKVTGPTALGAGTIFAYPWMSYVPVSAIPSTIAGSISSGTFVNGETLTQTTSGSTAILKGAFSTSLTVSTITGTPDSSDIWTGGTSSATFTPTATPVQTLTQAQWDTEMARWRMELWHGIVPASATAGTVYGGTANPVNVGPLVGATVNVPSARGGSFVCTGGGTITIANANELATSDVLFSLNAQGGTITTPPAMKTVTAGTGFTVLCGATDTSTYNYVILN